MRQEEHMSPRGKAARIIIDLGKISTEQVMKTAARETGSVFRALFFLQRMNLGNPYSNPRKL